MNLEARWGPAVLSEGLGLRHLSVMESTRSLRRTAVGERFCRRLFVEYLSLIICLIRNAPEACGAGGAAPSEPRRLPHPALSQGEASGDRPSSQGMRWSPSAPLLNTHRSPPASGARSASPEMFGCSCELGFFITSFLWLIIRRDGGCHSTACS